MEPSPSVTEIVKLTGCPTRAEPVGLIDNKVVVATCAAAVAGLEADGNSTPAAVP